ncbi:MAG TPA: NrfD/PsrC family molybdoenzyme membrane anchor subunit [Burkholderiales bacterium]|nr:NrfD/PsrC family molybdoenzyme membrane anchor subunit [Burkholderiales bacterium]
MNTFPSSTFFSASPDWGWLVTLYFFVGGLAGGCYFLAAMIDFFGRPTDRPLARIGYYISFPCIVLSGILLTLDLHRPLRFWHMLLESNTFRPMFKPWSPMSIGSWALTIFGLFSLIKFLSALAEDGRFNWPEAQRWRPPHPVGTVVSIIGGLLGFFVAGYTGVLLAVTNRPIWSDSSLLGMLFIISAASTSAALMLLLAQRSRATIPGISALHRLDGWVVLLELIVLVAFLISLGPVFRAFLNAWGVLLFLGVIVVGMLIPLALSWRRDMLGERNLVGSAVLVLIGGFLLRLIIVFSAQGV